jgi:light-independent protochlorophyllide reductase subunit B
MRSMLERERNFTPVTSSIVDRHVLARGSQEKVVSNLVRKDQEEQPELILLTPTCTSSILQEDLQNFVTRASLQVESDIILADVNHYRVNELQAADKTLTQIVKFYLAKGVKYQNLETQKTDKPSVNIIGAVSLGFHMKHDLSELKKLLQDLDVDVNLVIPEGASTKDLVRLPKAWFNILMNREIGLSTVEYLKTEFNMDYVSGFPIGVLETSKFVREIQSILGNLGRNVDFEEYILHQTKFISQSAWFSRSIDCQNLTGKRAVVFGDSTHAAFITKILSREMGIHVSWAGTYCKFDEVWFREQVDGLCDHVVITEDHAFIRDLIKKTEPAAIFGTQMERHIGKKLQIPCGVISLPAHIQDFPLSYKPFFCYEGSNQISDLVYNSFTLGMEDHLLELFGGHDLSETSSKEVMESSNYEWSEEAKDELKKVPGFVRNKVKTNTERFSAANNIKKITLKTMYEAKESLAT